MDNKIDVIEKTVKKMNSIFSAIGAGMLFFLMLVGATDVIGRYLFNKPIMGAQEMGTVLLALMVFLSWGSTQIAKAHVNVELFTSRFPPRMRVITNLINNLFSLILFSLVFWYSAMNVVDSYKAGRLIYVIHWPLAPFQVVVPFGALLLCIVFIMEIRNSFFKIKKKEG